MSFLGDIQVEFEGRPFRLVLGMNAYAEYEAATGIHYQALNEALEKGMVSAQGSRHLVRACLLRHHKDATLEFAGDLLSAYPDLIVRLFRAAAPTAAEQERLGN